jgi:uncharacterized phage protein gp47/JayE
MSNVPVPTFGPAGFVAPDETDVLSGVQADINAAFGGELNPALETPQGQLASSMAACIGNSNDTFVKQTQMSDPQFAEGRWQDGIGRIYFIERNGAQPTVVTATCIGAVGTSIPVGAQAVAEDGNIYTCTQAGTIPASGTIDLTFACNTLGPVPCPANTLNAIYRALPGWDSINNAADGVLGRDTESRAEFEDRRRLSVAQNANGSLPAILGAILNVDGVLDAFVTENVENTSQSIGGVTLVPNSIYASVVGGTADDVAKAIWSRKSPGCAYNGNTTVTVYDENPAYNQPFPAYQVFFERPASTTIIFAVNIANSLLVPSDAATQIQTAIIAAFAGSDGGPRARIGSTIYASRYYAPIANLGSWAQIISLQIGCVNNAAAAFTATISGTALTVSSVASGALAIGQTILGPNIEPGTTITGGSGLDWTVSISQNVASQTMYGVLSDQNDVSMRIDQAPVVSADDIVVTLT